MVDPRGQLINDFLAGRTYKKFGLKIKNLNK